MFTWPMYSGVSVCQSTLVFETWEADCTLDCTHSHSWKCFKQNHMPNDICPACCANIVIPGRPANSLHLCWALFWRKSTTVLNKQKTSTPIVCLLIIMLTWIKWLEVRYWEIWGQYLFRKLHWIHRDLTTKSYLNSHTAMQQHWWGFQGHCYRGAKR